MPADAQLVFSTFPDIATARQIGTVLVERQLAACVNLVPSMTAIYQWKGKIEESAEVLALFKVLPTNYPSFEAALAELHPYEVPEILAVDVTAGLPAYLEWLAGKGVTE